MIQGQWQLLPARARRTGGGVRYHTSYGITVFIGMSCPSWQWHRTGSRWSPVRTLPVAPLWCDLGFFPNSRGNKAAANLRPRIEYCAWTPLSIIKSLGCVWCHWAIGCPDFHIQCELFLAQSRSAVLQAAYICFSLLLAAAYAFPLLPAD